MGSSTFVSAKNMSVEDFFLKYGAFESQIPLSKQDFIGLIEIFPDLQIEREANGIISVMSPLKKGSGKRENRLNFLLNLWNESQGKGQVFGPNGTYDLPDGAIKMPDVSWLSPERQAEEPDDEESFIQVVPDFVVEIRSKTDRLAKLQQKMTNNWLANGVKLAWLIDPYKEQVFVYRQGKEVECVKGFEQKLSGEEVLPGFELNLSEMRAKK